MYRITSKPRKTVSLSLCPCFASKHRILVSNKSYLAPAGGKVDPEVISWGLALLSIAGTAKHSANLNRNIR